MNNGDNTIAIIKNGNGVSMHATMVNGYNNAIVVIYNSVSVISIIDNRGRTVGIMPIIDNCENAIISSVIIPNINNANNPNAIISSYNSVINSPHYR